MAAVLKSTARGGTKQNPTSNSDKETKSHSVSRKEPPIRRSRSVSAFSRSHPHTSSGREPPQPLSVSVLPADFLITRDNPLFGSSVSPPKTEVECQNGIAEASSTSKNRILTESGKPTRPKSPPTASSDDNRRGRSVSRNADATKRGSGIGRSLSRVDTGRHHRSVSRGPVARGNSLNSESEVEQESSLLTKQRNRTHSSSVSSVGSKSNSLKTSSNAINQMKSGKQLDGYASPTNLPSSPTASWEDDGFGSSISEAQERTVRAVCEQMKSFQGDNFGGDASSRIYETVQYEVRRAIADIQNDLESAIRRSNATAIATANITDIPPDLVNPSAVELILDIRREYGNKLEQSQERARKLRADLAIEEHRGLEISRILKEVLPNPKTSNVQKSRPVRKSSIERRRMSKRLTEEAMAYFDECVSLSTFDSSDFSSPEDPPINLGGISASVSDHSFIPQANSGAATSHWQSDKQETGNTCANDVSRLPANINTTEPILDKVMRPNSLMPQHGQRFQFSFACEPNGMSELKQDFSTYAKNFEKEVEEVDVNLQNLRRTHFDIDEYNLRTSPQSLLFDRVLYKNRIESGSMVLCNGGIAVSSLNHLLLF